MLKKFFNLLLVFLLLFSITSFAVAQNETVESEKSP